MNSTTVFEKFLEPIKKNFIQNKCSRKCNSISDKNFLSIGLNRAIGSDKSGRAFLQRLMLENKQDIETTLFFNAIQSQRRLSHLNTVFKLTTNHIDQELSTHDPLKKFKELDLFDIYASDGSYIEWACHDEKFRKKEKSSCDENTERVTEHQKSKRSCQSFYSCNLRTQTMKHLTVAQIGGVRQKEHDMHALKRISPEELRLGAKTKRKVLHVYDRAGMDLYQWENWKYNSGIYFLTREKKLNKLQVLGESLFDKNDPVNEGVIKDHYVSPGNTRDMRRVTYMCPETNIVYKFVTNLSMSIRPGVVVMLYKARWNIEKAFDTLKNKIDEKKAWGSRITAKKTQALFTCLAYKLSLFFNQVLSTEENIKYHHDKERRDKRLNAKINLIKSSDKKVPSTWLTYNRITQITIKFYRWLRASFTNNDSLQSAIPKLRALYATF